MAMAERVFSPSRFFTSSPGQRLFDLLAPGLYAWGVTVAWPAAQRLAPFESRVLAGAALASLVTGAVLSPFWPSAGRIAGLWLFLACSLGTWAILQRSIAPSHLDPVHGVLGAVGWAAFAVVWGGERTAPDAPDAPQRALPWPDTRRRTTRIMALLAAAASVPIALAWWVQSIERALLAHAVSLGAGIALLACATDLAAPASRETGPPLPAARPKRRLLDAAWPLAALVGLALAGALFGLLR
jgi:hypothetical protein